MAKKATFKIYEGLDKRKKKYVALSGIIKKSDMEAAATYMMRLNHCSAAHIDVVPGFIYKGQLYLISPNSKARLVTVLTYIR